MANYRMIARGKSSAELYLYDDIGDGLFGGINAKQVVDDIAGLGAIDLLNVRINSAGGAVFEGLAIYNALNRFKGKVEVDVDGLAGSIASIIAMAGSDIRMAENATMMIHDPMGMAMGTAEDMRKMADALDGVRTSLAETYAARSGQSIDAISEMMAAETWMNADEAVEQGFADSVSQPLRVAAHLGSWVFKHAPAALKASVPRPNADLHAARLSHLLRRKDEINAKQRAK